MKINESKNSNFGQDRAEGINLSGVKAKSNLELKVQKCYSTWGATYYEEYYGEKAPYPPVHASIVDNLLDESSAVRILDAGCGPASMLRLLAKPGRELYGFDLTTEMVEEGKRVAAEIGIPPEHIWQGSVLNPQAFRPEDHDPRFDAVICVGVLPHIAEQDEEPFLKNLIEAVRPGGLVVLEGRNRLFGLFTLNRYAYELFEEDFLHPADLKAEIAKHGVDEVAVDTALQEVRKCFRMDLPPLRKGKESEPGYDEITSRTHNPLLLRERAERAGLVDLRILYYHYHCVPPLAKDLLGSAFVPASLALENPQDWRGMFMASAFFLVGVRSPHVDDR